jgi:hypothetical protein
MELMLDRMQHPHRPGVDLLIPFELVVRESCGPATGESGFKSGVDCRSPADAMAALARKSAEKARVQSKQRAT